MNLIESLHQVKDPRREQGQRYSSVAMLLIIIMSILRNKNKYREIGRFCKLNASDMVELFSFKNGKVPSHVSLRTFIMKTDFASAQAAFHQWTQRYVQIDEGEWISIDGKSIRSTVSDYSSQYQNFVSLVSLFCQKREQIIHVEKLETKKTGEGKVVEDLLDVLDLKGVNFTMDALHCKKNSTQNRSKRQSLSGKSQRQSTKIVAGN
jgi:hypothetical protein